MRDTEHATTSSLIDPDEQNQTPLHSLRGTTIVMQAEWHNTKKRAVRHLAVRRKKKKEKKTP